MFFILKFEVPNDMHLHKIAKIPTRLLDAITIPNEIQFIVFLKIPFNALLL